MDKVRELDNLEKDLNQGAATAVYYIHSFILTQFQEILSIKAIHSWNFLSVLSRI